MTTGIVGGNCEDRADRLTGRDVLPRTGNVPHTGVREPALRVANHDVLAREDDRFAMNLRSRGPAREIE